jgi:PhzF family phenazine biosynthesis protein
MSLIASQPPTLVVSDTPATEATSLSDDQMLAIANEMNLSETAFVLPSDKADFRIRWFTTEREVLFCGHATVAAMHASKLGKKVLILSNISFSNILSKILLLFFSDFIILQDFTLNL